MADNDISVQIEVHSYNGQSYKIPNLLTPGLPIEASEYDQIKIVISGTGHKVTLRVGDYEVPLSSGPESTLISLGFSPFKNMMGYCQFVLTTEDSTLELRTFRVYGAKATYQRAKEYLSFLRESSDDLSNLCFSTSKMNSDQTPSSISMITRKLELGIQALESIRLHRSRFIQDPIFRGHTQISLEPYSASRDIGYEGVNFLVQNPHHLHPVPQHEADATIRNRQYSIDQVAVSVAANNYNVFENQVIYSFIRNFYVFIKNAKEALSNTKQNGRKNYIETQHRVFYSIEGLIEDMGLVLSSHQEELKRALKLINETQSFFDSNFKIALDQSQSYRPIPTSKVLMKGHYREVFSILKSYYEAGEPTFQGTDSFYGLRSMPKIYELVCLTQLILSLQQKGYQVNKTDYVDFQADFEPSIVRPVNEPNNYYRMESGSSNVTLYYDASIKLAKRARFSNLPLVDICHAYSTREGMPITWTPDFVIAHETPTQKRVHILDAKYSKLDSVTARFHGSMWLLSHKYLTLSRKVVNGELFTPDSMHILYSADSSQAYTSAYPNEYSPFCTNGRAEKPLMPAIGGLNIDHRGVENLTKLLNWLL